MRTLFLNALLVVGAITPFAAAQVRNAAWDAIERLPQGTAVRVHTGDVSLSCAFLAADDTSLTCQKRSHWFTPRRTATYSRADILWVKGSRKELSTLTGGLVGLGVGAAIGAGVDSSSKSNEDPHLATAAFALLGLPFGLIVGDKTDFLAGPVLYRKR